ncbi:hypothetical protein R1flu_020986 [Riccia fluitans]|uniref:Beta-amylase n=1 Tax=Riccia fluitans TaxID=41844 RepID=A0ABD1ZN37_9MARC
MSSPTSFSFLSSFSSVRTSKFSNRGSSEPATSQRNDPLLRVLCFAPNTRNPIPGGQIVNGGPRQDQQQYPPADEWWRRPPQHRGRDNNSEPCADLRQSVLRTGQSVSDWVLDPKELRKHTFHETPTSVGTTGGVPVFVMMPLDSVSINNTVSRRRAVNASLAALKCAGVEGIMLDVWWGIVEQDSPMEYNWGAYRELIDIAKKHGLIVQAVMSFHQCGGNVGDSCTIPLPKWVVDEIRKNPDIVYTDKSGNRNYEYLSLGCDELRFWAEERPSKFTRIS